MKKQLIGLLMGTMLLTSCYNTNYTFPYTLSIPYLTSSDKGYTIIDPTTNQEVSLQAPFNTSMSIRITENFSSPLVTLSNKIIETVQLYHIYFDSNYKYLNNLNQEINNLYTINQSYGKGDFIPVSEPLFDALKLGVEFTKLTDGYFNLGIGALSDVWEDKYEFPVPLEDPTEEAINQALICTPTSENIDEVLELDQTNHQVRLNALSGCQGQVKLSMGAFGKGIATDQIARLMKEAGAKGIISSGESSIQTLGNREWKILFRNPVYQYYASLLQLQEAVKYNPNELVLSKKGDFAVSTSGDYNKFFLSYGGLIRHHILNPKTGYPENYFRQVSLISNDSVVADILTTALMSVTFEEAIIMLNRIQSEKPELVLLPFFIKEDRYNHLLIKAPEDLRDNLSLLSGAEKPFISEFNFY